MKRKVVAKNPRKSIKKLAIPQVCDIITVSVKKKNPGRNGMKIFKEVDESEDLLYGKDNDGSGIPEEIKDKEYRLKRLEEARMQLEAEKLSKVNVTDPDAPLVQDSKKVIQPCYNGQVGVDAKIAG